MSNVLKRNLNRSERRKMNARDIQAVKENTQDELASMLLSVWVDVLWDDVEEEAIQDWINRVVDKYNEIDDFSSFREEVYKKTGMGIFRTNILPNDVHKKTEEEN